MHALQCQPPPSPGLPALLLVEDHDSYRELVKKALGTFLPGWQIQEAGSVSAAVEELGRSAFDVVICDMTLPDGAATDVVDKLPLLQGQKTRVIVFSNHLEAQIAPLRTRTDIHGFITKERGLKELAQMVQHVAASHDFNPSVFLHA